MAEDINHPTIDDPYTFAMGRIMGGINKALDNQDGMSDEEFSILHEIRGIILRRDPASLDIQTDPNF